MKITIKSIKTRLALAMIIAASSSYSLGVSEGPDCNGTTTQSCQLPTNQCGYTWYATGGVYNNCCLAYGTGANSINICTSGNSNNGLCGSDGTVSCSYSVTITSSSGDVIFTGSNTSSPTTYKCFN